MSFHVGQLVVCVDDVPMSGRDPNMDGLRRGCVYTIRQINVRWPTTNLTDGVRLAEIVRVTLPHEQAFGEIPYRPDRFRSLDESKLQIFREMLVSPRKRVRTDA